MSRTLEIALHWWACLTVVIIGLVAAVAETPLSHLGGGVVSIVSGLAGCVVAGFYFYMLVECVRGTRIKHRVAWIILFILFPIFSAIIYFIISRSTLYSSPQGASVT